MVDELGFTDAGQAIRKMLPQLLIALVNRSDGKLKIPAAEIDATGEYVLAFSVDQETREFTFETTKKN